MVASQMLVFKIWTVPNPNLKRNSLFKLINNDCKKYNYQQKYHQNES